MPLRGTVEDVLCVDNSRGGILVVVRIHQVVLDNDNLGVAWDQLRRCNLRNLGWDRVELHLYQKQQHREDRNHHDSELGGHHYYCCDGVVAVWRNAGRTVEGV